MKRLYIPLVMLLVMAYAWLLPTSAEETKPVPVPKGGGGRLPS